MPNFQYFKDAILNTARGTALAAYTSHLTFSKTKPVVATNSFTPPTYAGFARVANTMGAPATSSGTTRRSSNTAVANFPTVGAGAGEWVGWGVECDALSGGNNLRFNALPNSGAAIAISSTTGNGVLITVTTTGPHGLALGQAVRVTSVVGNTAANDEWTVTPTGANTFTLDGSTGNGAYVSGGTVQAFGFQLVNGLEPRIPIGNFFAEVQD
jgi:hypothetical protein